MFDIKKIEEEAKKEVNDELAISAKTQIKAKLKQIDTAKKVLVNLNLEYDSLLREIGTKSI